MKTSRDIKLNLWGTDCTIPAGTAVQMIKCADGIKGDLYAVSCIAELIRITGNTHDPKYRYAFIDEKDVKK